MNNFDDLVNHIHNAPKREVVMTYIVSFRLPTFAPGVDHGRDYLFIGNAPTRMEADYILQQVMAANATGVSYIRDVRKVLVYTQAGTFLGHYIVSAREVI